MTADLKIIACPFCGGQDPGSLCLDCGRDKAAPRRICAGCGAQTPLDGKTCHACGQRQTSDLRWKIPTIIAMFAAALAIAVFLRT